MDHALPIGLHLHHSYFFSPRGNIRSKIFCLSRECSLFTGPYVQQFYYTMITPAPAGIGLVSRINDLPVAVRELFIKCNILYPDLVLTFLIPQVKSGPVTITGLQVDQGILPGLVRKIITCPVLFMYR